MNKNFRDKILTSFCVSLFFALTLFAFGPVNLYLINIVEFSSSFAELWPIFISLTLACALIMTIFLIVLKLAIYRKAVSVLLAVSFLLWVQGNILVWDYGILDGTNFDMHSKLSYGLIDSGIWIVTIAVAFMTSSYLSKNARGLSAIFILVQLIPVIVNARQAPDVSEMRKNLGADKEAVYELSPEGNVLIIVLDAFQGDIFNDIIAEDSYYGNIFDGFTYFRNALGGYPRTSLSIPLILTGQYYDNAVPFPEFLKTAFSADSAPAILSKEGYRVDLIGHIPLAYPYGTGSANHTTYKQLLGRNVKMKEVLWILDISLFRYLPHFAKKHIYNNQAWLLSNLDSKRGSLAEFPAGDYRDSIEFMMGFADRANADSDKLTFKYLHIYIPHFPVRINEDFEYVEEARWTRRSFTGQSKAALKLVDEIFQKMEDIGVYDNTMIFVVADHGIPLEVDMKIGGDHEEEAKSPIVGRLDDETLQQIKGSALPLFLFKPVMSRGDLDISDAPVCLSDIPKTIVSELGLRNKTPGQSILSIGETDHRDRRFLFHGWGFRFWEKYRDHHMPPLDEYNVSGRSWLDESWHPTNRIYTYGKATQELSQTYNYGEKIEFGVGGNYTSYRMVGWSYPEEGVTWNDYKSPKIIIPIQKTDSDVVLRASLTPYIHPGEVDRQRVRVFFNGRFITEWVITDGAAQEQTALIPNRFLEGDVAAISFALPDAASAPASEGEARVFGIGMHSITISISESESETHVYRWGSLIRFDQEKLHQENGWIYQEDGWGFPGNGSTWTDGKSASLMIPVAKTESDIQLKATLRPYVVSGKIEEQRVIISVNGKHAGDWVIPGGQFQEQTIHIPNSLINDEVITVTFELPDAISPAELGVSKDMRELALAVASIVLTEFVPESVN